MECGMETDSEPLTSQKGLVLRILGVHNYPGSMNNPLQTTRASSSRLTVIEAQFHWPVGACYGMKELMRLRLDSRYHLERMDGDASYHHDITLHCRPCSTSSACAWLKAADTRYSVRYGQLLYGTHVCHYHGNRWLDGQRYAVD